MLLKMYNKNTFKKFFIILCFFFTISFGKPDPKLISFETIDSSNNSKEITITFIIPEKDFIYKDFISCSINEPGIVLSPWKADTCSIEHYDPSFKETKPVFNETFSISMTASTNVECYNEPIHLYCSYYRNSDKKINHVLFPMMFNHPIDTHLQVQDAIIEESVAKKQVNNSDQHHSLIDIWSQHCIIAIHNCIAIFETHHQKIMYFFMFLISLILLIIYFYREQFQKHKHIYESIEITLSFCVTAIIIYVLIYFYAMSTPTTKAIVVNISALFSGIAGIFYIKKSTNLQSGFLRTFCTCLGNVFIYSAVYLSFKTLQFYL
jgi:hypothetical protein